MKMNLLNLTSKKVSVRKLVLTAMMFAGMVFNANANYNLPVTTDTEIDVTPKGIVQDAMIFNLNFNNANGDTLDIKIIDENGTKVYKEIFTGKVLNKTFKVDSEFGTVSLFIVNTKDNSEHKFVITTKEGEKVLITSVY